VIPVLVGQAQMPRADQLPEGMKPLATRNAVRLTHERFRSDAQGLVTALQRVLKGAEDARAAEAEAAWRREAEEKQRQQAEAAAQAREQADHKRRQREAEAEQQRAEAERQRAEEQRRRNEVEAKGRAEEEQRRAEKEERRRLRRSQARPLWPPPRPALAAGSSIALVALAAIGIWLLRTPPTLVPARTIPSAVSVLTPDQERALKPKDAFRECTNCPEMIVVPAGSFTMGSPTSEPGRNADEGP
jgi:hypothetical protein